MMPLVLAERVTKVYAGRLSGVTALSEVSLSIFPGELIVITGVSGSGKTTLLNLLGCLDRPTAGRIAVRGNDTHLLSRSELARLRGEHIGFLFQQSHLINHMTVLENVLLPFLVAGCKAQTRRAIQVLEAVGLPFHASRKASDLSGGERQRVAAARALVRDPDIILADEPTGSLDRRTGMTIVSLLADLLKLRVRRSVVLVTHQPELVSVPHRRFRLADGAISPDVG